MKIFKIFLLLSCVIAFFSSCETYGDADVDHSSVFPMSGEWIVQAKNTVTGEVYNVRGIQDDKFPIYTYNAANESITQMWLRIGGVSSSNSSPYAKFDVKGKVNINLGARTFDVNNIQNEYYTDNSKFTVTEGKVVLDGLTTPSGGKGDLISFKLVSDRDPGVTYEISGYRRTGWPEDEPTSAPTIRLSKTSVTLAVGTTTTSEITRGNGDYIVSTGDANVATATLSGTVVTITAVGAGGTRITVRDREVEETIVVTVTD